MHIGTVTKGNKLGQKFKTTMMEGGWEKFHGTFIVDDDPGDLNMKIHQIPLEGSALAIMLTLE